jgi:hypothetical protein
MYIVSSRVISRGLFIGVVRRSVNIFQTVPNQPGSNTKYIVMGSLQSFTTYEYFIHSLSGADTNLVIWHLRPAASDADGTFGIG